MNTFARNSPENTRQSRSQQSTKIKSDSRSTFQFVDNRPESIVQRNRQETASDSLQMKSHSQATNHTGLPDNLKTGMENLSGMSLGDVKVHRNSDKPSQMQAHAYAQGTDIHLAPGQEKHLPHEAWHVVQQKQGRVKPTSNLGTGSPINDDPRLEHEADVMGGKAVQNSVSANGILQHKKLSGGVKQFFWTRWYEFDGETYTARSIGLPMASGWIKLERQHEGKDVYMSFTNIHRLPAIQDVRQGVDEIRTVLNEHSPLLSGITQRLGNQEALLEDVERAQAQFLSVDRALGIYLAQTSTLLKILGSVLGFGVAITAGVLISYLTLPMWLVGLIEGLSFLYGCGLLYRWSKSQLLPNTAKVIMLLANGVAMGTALGLTVGPAIGYAAGLTSTMPLQHIQFAAIPFALLIEHFIVVFIEKANALRQAYNRRNGHHENHEE